MIIQVLLLDVPNPKLSVLKKENQLTARRRVVDKLNSLSWSRDFPPFIIPCKKQPTTDSSSITEESSPSIRLEKPNKIKTH
jgi:hypothetical protein